MTSLHERLLGEKYCVSGQFFRKDVAAGLGKVVSDYAQVGEDFHVSLASVALKDHSKHPNFIPLEDCYLVYSKTEIPGDFALAARDGNIIDFKREFTEFVKKNK